MEWTCSVILVAFLQCGCLLAQDNSESSDTRPLNNETITTNNDVITTKDDVKNIHDITTIAIDTTVLTKQNSTNKEDAQLSTSSSNITKPVDISTTVTVPLKDNGPTTVAPKPSTTRQDDQGVNDSDTQTELDDQSKLSSTTVNSNIANDLQTTAFTHQPTLADLEWMHTFLSTHHFEGTYSYNNVQYLFSFVARHKHQLDYKTLVASFYDQDGAVLEFNGTSSDGHIIVFTLARIYTPGTRFPLNLPLQMTGQFPVAGSTFFKGNFTQPTNASFSWFRMNTGLGTVETGETEGTRTAIIIIIPTSIAFLGICGTVAIICWASKKGYLRGRHKSYRLFTDAQVSYESEAETIHI